MNTPWHPSRKAIKRVKDKAPIPKKCLYCDSKVVIRNNGVIYGKPYGKWPWVYLCPKCFAYVGMHPYTNIPLGTLADKETRKARLIAKKDFEIIWRTGKMSRTEAYQWLANELGIDTQNCHFGLFNIALCDKARLICERYLWVS